MLTLLYLLIPLIGILIRLLKPKVSKRIYYLLLIISMILIIIILIYIELVCGEPIKLDVNPYQLPLYKDGTIDLKKVNMNAPHIHQLSLLEQSARLHLHRVDLLLGDLKSIVKAIESASPSEISPLHDFYLKRQDIALKYFHQFGYDYGSFKRFNSTLIIADYRCAFGQIDMDLYKALRR